MYKRVEGKITGTRGAVAVGILIVLVTIVLTSALILVLVKSDIIALREDVATEPILNTEFLPSGREGEVVVREFEFCSYVDDDYKCLETADTFSQGSEVHFRFVVESSTYNGQVLLVENYRLISPFGELLLEAEQSHDYSVEVQEAKKKSQIVFKDFFILDSDALLGGYTLELIIKNPLLQKQVELTKTFEVVGVPLQSPESLLEEDGA